MPNDTTETRRERTGYLLMAGIVAAVALIINFGAVVDLFRDRYDLIILLPEAGGVRSGTSVRVAGYESGVVTDIQMLEERIALPPEDTASVAVTVRLEGDTRIVIRTDSPVKAGARRFIGEALILIEPGTSAGAPITDGDTLAAVAREAPGAVLEQARAFPDQLDSLMESAGRVGELMDRRRPELRRLEPRLTRALDEAGRLRSSFEGGSLGRLLNDGDLGARVAALRERMTELTAAVDSATARYTGDDAELGHALERLSARAGAVDAELARLQQRMDEGQGVLARMSRDSAIAVAMNGVRAQIDTLRAEAMSVVMRMFLPGGGQ